jgi:hypothetical protein
LRSEDFAYQQSGGSSAVPRAQGDWRLLSGKRWMVCGQADAMTALQQQWGGDLETIAAQDSGQ